MRVLILNKQEFNNFMTYNVINENNVEAKDIMVISINQTKHDDWALDMFGIQSYFKRHRSNVMIMHFPDVGEQYHLNNPDNPRLFTPYKAKKLYEFIKRNKDKSMAVVHCGAGISRSGAVGAFIQDLYGTLSWEEFKRKNPRILPNSYVYRLLHEELIKDKYNKK